MESTVESFLKNIGLDCFINIFNGKLYTSYVLHAVKFDENMLRLDCHTFENLFILPKPENRTVLCPNTLRLRILQFCESVLYKIIKILKLYRVG